MIVHEQPGPLPQFADRLHFLYPQNPAILQKENQKMTVAIYHSLLLSNQLWSALYHLHPVPYPPDIWLFSPLRHRVCCRRAQLPGH